jgi:hypothetical protein
MRANRMPASCFLNPKIFRINSHIPIVALVQLHFPIGRGGHFVEILQNGKNRLLFLCPLKEKQKKEQNPTHTI